MVMKRFLSWLNPFEGESPGEIHQKYSRRYNDMINDLKTDYSVCKRCKHSVYGKRNPSSICICDVCDGNNEYEVMTKTEIIQAILESEFDDPCEVCGCYDEGRACGADIVRCPMGFKYDVKKVAEKIIEEMEEW